MTKYRQKDNEAVIKVTNDVEVSFNYPHSFDYKKIRFPHKWYVLIVLAI